MTTEQNAKVNVKGGRYSGRKWFIKIAYKLIETDVEFYDNEVVLSQGTGFAIVKNKSATNIKYSDITSVETKKKYSIPNIVLATFAVLCALMTGIWEALILAVVVAWIGSTAVVSIQHSDGVFEIPTEFKSEANELKEKINTAITQSK